MKTFLFYLTKPQSQVCILNIQIGFFAWVGSVVVLSNVKTMKNRNVFQLLLASYLVVSVN